MARASLALLGIAGILAGLAFASWSLPEDRQFPYHAQLTAAFTLGSAGSFVVATLLGLGSAVVWVRTRFGKTQDRAESEAASLSREERLKLADRGMLDFIVNGVDAAVAFGEILNSIAKDTGVIAKRYSHHTKRLPRVKRNPRKLRKLASDLALDIENYCDSLEARLEPLRASLTFAGDYQRVIEGSPPGNAQDEQGLESLLAVVLELRTASTGVKQGISTFRGSAVTVRELGLSQNLNGANDRLLPIIDEIDSIFGDVIDAFDHLSDAIAGRLAA